MARSGHPSGHLLDGKDEPSFLHALSGKNIRSHDYYHAHRKKGRWSKP